MKIIGIYKITSPTNKIYIGQSVDMKSRWQKYNTLKCKQQSKLYASFIKHGVENHKFEIIAICDKSELNNLERVYIDLYDSFNTKHGMNLLSGGNAFSLSDETKNKLRLANLGKKQSAETIQKRVSKNTGKKRSEEAKIRMRLSRPKTVITQEMKDRISKTLTGRKLPQEVKDKIRAKSLLHRHSPETIEKIKLAQKDRSAEWRDNLSKSQKCKRVAKLNIETNDVIEVYDSIGKAARANNIHTGGIYGCCECTRNRAGNFKWQYADK